MRLQLNSCAANQIIFNFTSTKFSSAKLTHYPITSKPKYLVIINKIQHFVIKKFSMFTHTQTNDDNVKVYKHENNDREEAEKY